MGSERVVKADMECVFQKAPVLMTGSQLVALSKGRIRMMLTSSADQYINDFLAEWILLVLVGKSRS